MHCRDRVTDCENDDRGKENAGQYHLEHLVDLHCAYLPNIDHSTKGRQARKDQTTLRCQGFRFCRVQPHFSTNDSLSVDRHENVQQSPGTDTHS